MVNFGRFFNFLCSNVCPSFRLLVGLFDLFCLSFWSSDFCLFFCLFCLIVCLPT